MKIFVKRRHYAEVSLIGLGIIFCLIFAGMPLRDMTLEMVPVALTGVVLSAGMTVVLVLYFRKFGLYIFDERVFNKGFRTVEINPQHIAAIRVTKSVVRTWQLYFDDEKLKDKDGNQLYSMLLLNCYEPWRMHSEDFGEVTMLEINRGKVLCYAVYDRKAINYLCSLNPKIVVIPPDGGAPVHKPGTQQGWITDVRPKGSEE